jgi:hypothetical protein
VRLHPFADLGIRVEPRLLRFERLQRRLETGGFARGLLQAVGRGTALSSSDGSRASASCCLASSSAIRPPAAWRCDSIAVSFSGSGNARPMFSCLSRFFRASICESSFSAWDSRVSSTPCACSAADISPSAARTCAAASCAALSAAGKASRARTTSASVGRSPRGGVDLGRAAVALVVGLRDAALHLGRFRAERFELRAHAPAVLAEEGDLLLERLDLRVRRVERALQLLEVVGFLVMAARNCSSARSDLAQLRHLGFERHLHLLHFVGVAVARLLGLAQPREREQVVVKRELRLQLVVARGDLGLLREVLELRRELGADVADADRFSRVSSRRSSVSRRRSRYLDTPAASSRKTRSSSGFDVITREIIPCSMIE